MTPRIRLLALEPLAIGVAVLICGLYAFANVVLVTVTWEFDDVHAYLGAAERLLVGEPLYVRTPDPSDTFFYAPWFAFLWIPFVTLSRVAVEVVWAAVLVAASIAAVLPFRRSWAGVALALLLGALLYRTAGWGNIQPLLVAALVYCLPTPAGPWLVGVAASMKPWALLTVAVYAGRRQWAAVAISIGVAAVLWLPILLFNWGDYPGGTRAPNIYDATFLLAVPASIGRRRHASPSQADQERSNLVLE